MKLFLKTVIIIFFTLFVIPSVVSAQIYTTEKMITVDIGSQRLTAWEGGQVQYQTRVSTGMRYTPTIRGSFKIGRKVPLQNMKGSYPPYEPYFIKNVPNVMYFSGAYAIHGAYWHNGFGSKVTHGCVNVPVAASQWLYDWAPSGTRVEIF